MNLDYCCKLSYWYKPRTQLKLLLLTSCTRDKLERGSSKRKKIWLPVWYSASICCWSLGGSFTSRQKVGNDQIRALSRRIHNFIVQAVQFTNTQKIYFDERLETKTLAHPECLRCVYINFDLSLSFRIIFLFCLQLLSRIQRYNRISFDVIKRLMWRRLVKQLSFDTTKIKGFISQSEWTQLCLNLTLTRQLTKKMFPDERWTRTLWLW